MCISLFTRTDQLFILRQSRTKHFKTIVVWVSFLSADVRDKILSKFWLERNSELLYFTICNISWYKNIVFFTNIVRKIIFLISVQVKPWPGIAPSGPIWRPEFGSLVVSSHRWQSEFRRISASANVSSEHNNNRSPEFTSWRRRRFEFFHFLGSWVT